jgi:hypothetical protein
VGAVLVDIDVAKDSVTLRVGDEEPIVGASGLEEQELERLQGIRETGTPDDYGWELMQLSFRDEVAQGLRNVLNRAKDSRDPWRVRLHIDPKAEELLPLWWECLYDRGEHDSTPYSFGRRNITPFSRYINAKGRPAVSADKLRVLVVVSNPTDLGAPNSDYAHLTRLQDKQEIWSIRQALDAFGDRIEATILTDPASLGEIQERLMDSSGNGDGYHVLHLIGHAVLREGEPTLLLETQDGQRADPVPQGDFAQAVSDATDLRLMVFAGTFTGSGSEGEAFVRLAASAVEGGIPAAIAMRHQVTATVTDTFNKHFYGLFAKSSQFAGRVDEAMSQARARAWNAVRGRPGEEWDWSIPVLFMRGEGDLFSTTDGEGGARVAYAAPPTAAAAAAGGIGQYAPPLPPANPADVKSVFRDVLREFVDSGGDVVLGNKTVQYGDQFGGSKNEGDVVAGDVVAGDKAGGDKVEGDKVGQAADHLAAQAPGLTAASKEESMDQERGGINFGGIGNVGGDVVAGDKVGGDQVAGDKIGGDSSVGGDKVGGDKIIFDRVEFASGVDQVVAGLQQAGGADPNVQEAIGHLEEAKQAAQAEAPPEEVKDKFDRATEVLEKSQEVVKKGIGLAELLKKAAKIVGAVIAWL